ncbi:MAG TPA: cell division protein FtsL [Gammaproteobacteria bacterium]|nr:cell division protein FtsL [Gammaproteobacteria bacterium]
MNAAARILNQGVLSHGWVISVLWKRSQLPMLLMIMSVLVTGLGVIYMTNTTRSLNANIQQTLAERERLHVQWGQLLLEKSTWIMQARVQNLAEGKLGMIVPGSHSVVVVNLNHG